MHGDRELLLQASARISSFAHALWAEDEAAEAVCRAVLSGPAAWWPQRLRKTPGAHTAGTVRALLRRMPQLYEKRPTDALQLTTMANAVAQALDPAEYPDGVVIRVRAQALRDHATVLSHMAHYVEALEAIERSAVLYQQVSFADFELARLALTKACALRQVPERAGEGTALAREAGATFLRLGERGRHAAARIIESALLYEEGAIERTLEVSLSLEHDPHLTALDRLRVQHNIATCRCDLGESAAAVEPLQRCVAEFERLDRLTERTRSRWKLGVALLGTLRITEAIATLRQAWEEFGKQDLTIDAALAAMDLAEALLINGERETVLSICHDLIERFTEAGLPARAITALSLLRKAAEMGNVSRELVRRTQATVSWEGRRFAATRP